jgi:phosphoribosylamine-glycine ligase
LAANSKSTKVSLPLVAPFFKEMVQFAVDHHIDLVVPGPEIPLVDGINDAFQKGITIAISFSPSKWESIVSVHQKLLLN